MMNQQPDIFFRKKLQGYQMPLPTSAWDKIEARLDKKSNKKIWLSIAASVSILTIAMYLLWPESTPEVTAQLNGLTFKPQRKETTIAKSATKLTEIHEQKESHLIKKSKSTLDKEETQSGNLTSTIINEESTYISATEKFSSSSLDKINYVNDTLSAEAKVSSIVIETEQSETGVTLIYKIDEVNEKYLDKDKLAEATQDDKKTSKLMKLLYKVYDLKNDKDPLGELRQKKDEILALNFKNKSGNQ